jgi:CBS domain-containing protein
MKVKEIHTSDVKSVRPDANLAHAAVIMWDNDCGVVPVVEREGQLIGIISDRDICIALGTRAQRAGEVNVQDAMSRNVRTCRPTDEVDTALETMADERVRRLPVVDEKGILRGILSINDVLNHLDDRTAPSRNKVLNVLKVICEPGRVKTKAQAAPKPEQQVALKGR